MKWTVESFDERNARKNEALREQYEYEKEWHPWFAWKPVLVSPKEKVWLRMVERRLNWWDRQSLKWYCWDIRRHEYRLPEKK